jgi:hypothetical protein
MSYQLDISNNKIILIQVFQLNIYIKMDIGYIALKIWIDDFKTLIKIKQNWMRISLRLDQNFIYLFIYIYNKGIIF